MKGKGRKKGLFFTVILLKILGICPIIKTRFYIMTETFRKKGKWMIMDIAAMSMELASYKLGMEVGTSVSKKVMESAEVNAEVITEMIDAIEKMTPSENLIDVRA